MSQIKTKHNANARLDLEELCARDELHLRTRKNENSYKPKAKYTLSLKQKRLLCEWLRVLSLPDRYSFNFRNKVDMSSIKLQNMKSYTIAFLWSHSFQLLSVHCQRMCWSLCRLLVNSSKTHGQIYFVSTTNGNAS